MEPCSKCCRCEMAAMLIILVVLEAEDRKTEAWQIGVELESELNDHGDASLEAVGSTTTIHEM